MSEIESLNTSADFTSDFYTQDKPEKCDICGKVCSELSGGVCDACIDEHRRDFEMCRNIALGEVESIEISTIYTALYSAREIESILLEHIKTNEPNIDCSRFIDSDIGWFGQRLAEEVKK